MNIKSVQRKKERKSVALSIRTTKSVSQWMTTHNVSPTALFNEAVEELMLKEK